MAKKAATKKAPLASIESPASQVVEKTAPDPISSAYETAVGLTQAVLKKAFTGEVEPDSKNQKLRNLISDRIKEGRTWNLTNYRTFAAIDAALESTFDQVTDTLVNRIMQAGTAKGVMDGFKAWGIDASPYATTDDFADGKDKLFVPNRDSYIKTHVPAVIAYRNIRVGKLFNDRNQSPFFKYEPVKNTEKNRMMGEIITDLISEITHSYGYTSVLRQALIGAGNYSYQFLFPMEQWDVQKGPDGDGGDRVIKEGIRYNLPHPSRTAWDMTHRPSTFNTDTGCDWAFYWRIEKYGDVVGNTRYWNTDKISYGTNWFAANVSGNYFQEIYPCVAKNPFTDPTIGGAAAGTVTDREQAATLYTRGGDHDKAVFLTDKFMKLVPAYWGLSDYKYPVWLRLVVANDCDIIYAEPVAYSAVLWLGWDSDENRARNASLVLEILAFQNLISNQLTSILLASKQNNTKIIPYDTDQIDEDGLKELKKKNKDVTKVIFFPFSGKKFKMANLDPTKMFMPVQFPLQNVAELTNVLNTIINIMERLLGMASSEVGAAGAHIQTAEEIRVISNNTGTRLEFTGSFVDEFIDAWKVQLYTASQAFMDEDFAAVVSGINDDNIDLLKDMGFDLVGKPDANGMVEVKGKRSKVAMQYFISSREGNSRINQPQVAQVILQTIQVLAQPAMLQEVGAKEIVKMLNLAAQLLGAPKDFKIEANGQSGLMQQIQQELQQMSQQIQAAQQQTMQQVSQSVGPAIQKDQQDIQAQGQALQQIGGQQQQMIQALQSIGPIIAKIQQMLAPPPMPPQHPPMPMSRMQAAQMQTGMPPQLPPNIPQPPRMQ